MYTAYWFLHEVGGLTATPPSGCGNSDLQGTLCQNIGTNSKPTISGTSLRDGPHGHPPRKSARETGRGAASLVPTSIDSNCLGMSRDPSAEAPVGILRTLTAAREYALLGDMTEQPYGQLVRLPHLAVAARNPVRFRSRLKTTLANCRVTRMEVSDGFSEELCEATLQRSALRRARPKVAARARFLACPQGPPGRRR